MKDIWHLQHYAGLMMVALTFATAADAATVLRYEAAINGQSYAELGLERTIWLGRKCSREDNGPMSIIIDYLSDRVVILNHEESIYVQSERPFDISSVMSPDFLDSARASGLTTLVEDRHRREGELYPWSCDLVRMEVISLSLEGKTDFCLAHELPGMSAKEIEKYGELHRVGLFGQQVDEASRRELSKLEGVIVNLWMVGEMHSGNVELKVALVSINDEPMPLEHCQVPASYVRQPFLQVESGR